MRLSIMGNFLKLEAASGIILFITALLAVVICNSPFAEMYQKIWQTPLNIHIASVSLTQPLLFWINEGLMTLFFLLIGLELKREFVEGELASFSQIILPGVAALGGMLVPAVVYCLFNLHQPAALVGWAIPVATDIAFALGVLSLFGKRVPLGLKLFLMALAIFDDLGAILIIAIFHTVTLSYLSLGLAFLGISALLLLNRSGIRHLAPYLLIGFVVWICVLESGVHATVAGVLLAFMIPLRSKEGETLSPLQRLQDVLHPWVAYLVMPLFAFANAGLSFQGLSLDSLFDSVVLGVMLGLFLGKQVGVLSFAWLMIKLGWAKLPDNTSWHELYSVAILCGIGFTMSLFLGTLAFQGPTPAYLVEMRLGVLLGSVLSGVVGALMLQIAFHRKAKSS